MEKLKVVIADDAKINNDVLILELKKCEEVEIVGVAEDGVQEYELIKQRNPELVITDNQMPNMCGLEVIQKVSDENIENKPSFLIISSDHFEKLDFEKLNIIGIIPKPVNYNRMRSLIRGFAEEGERNIEELRQDSKNGIREFLKKFIGK